ncbi:intermembrane transport protein PqiB [Marinovum sp.]|uniref:PqiB family protein n=1 Tax=Marinovum sp. TaxID=2024839 RepID=UPI002B27663E|nr:MlaD family protein [Marinovum sp.]
MTEPTAADPVVRRARGPRFSVIWLVPIIALAVSLGIAWQTYADRGVLIEIAFDSASGIAAEKTELRYRDVTVGLVEQVRFSGDLSKVIASVRINRDLAPYLDEDADFWVVRPEITAQGISGLSTVLSGVYIVGQWDSSPGTAQTSFEGLEDAPLNDPTEEGTRIRLTARDSNSIVAGAPILYKGIPVGNVEAPQLAESRDHVVITGFIRAPYDSIITTDTRFWDISGVSVSLDTSGVSLNFASLASLVQGGVSFDTFVAGGRPATDAETFPLYADESAARSSLLSDPTAERLRVMVIFDGAVGGLTEGATVRFRGVPVGEVDNVAMIAADRDGRKVVRMRAILAISPARLGLSEDDGVDEAMDLLTAYVEEGLRVRLATASLLSSELVVDLVELPVEEEAEIVMTEMGLPQLPTIEAQVTDLNATAEGVFQRINNLPVEEVLASIQGLVDNASALIASEDIRAVAPGINATLADLRALQPEVTETLANFRSISPEVNATLAEFRTIAPELNETLDEATATLEEVRLIVAGLRESGATENINNVFASAANAADAVEAAAGELPKLTARLATLASRTEKVIDSYGDNSRLINGALSTLRDVSEAADALRSLARAIQRNPNSLIIGR